MKEKEILEKAKQIRQKENERLGKMTDEERRQDYEKLNEEMLRYAKEHGIKNNNSGEVEND